MDFKGHFATASGRCHPLTVLDDHSRFALSIAACADEQLETVTSALKSVFRRYGLPVWASVSAMDDPIIRRPRVRMSASIAP